jgi:hypothetical protein
LTVVQAGAFHDSMELLQAQFRAKTPAIRLAEDEKRPGAMTGPL